ncbi:MAG: hypothetical protein WCA44_01990 [Acidobacteriaceae bacterium]
MRWPGKLGFLLAAVLFAISACAVARADAALLLEEPFGDFGAMNPTGHSAVYLDHVCADSPTQLRLCRPGEIGVVISRYRRVDGYDWLAIPLIPYLYAVDNVDDIPSTATPRLERYLRERYRVKHLEAIVPDDPKTEIPGGDWIQLVGASYDRRIWGFEVATSERQDLAFIRRFNHRRNISHFNLLFNNCANFTQKVVNFYYPHAIRRNFVADVGVMTPKQAARSLVRYNRTHPQMDLRTFVIPQVPGTIPRSTPVKGVVESLVKSKKYVVPIAVLNPYVAGTLVAVWLGDGRFHPDAQAQVYNPLMDGEPCQPDLQPHHRPEPDVSAASQEAPAAAPASPTAVVNQR